MTLEVFGTYRADVTEPPEELVERIRARRGDWQPAGSL